MSDLVKLFHHINILNILLSICQSVWKGLIGKVTHSYGMLEVETARQYVVHCNYTHFCKEVPIGVSFTPKPCQLSRCPIFLRLRLCMCPPYISHHTVASSCLCC